MPSPSRLAALALAALLPIASLAQETASSGEEDGFWYAAAGLGAALPMHRDVKDSRPPRPGGIAAFAWTACS